QSCRKKPKLLQQVSGRYPACERHCSLPTDREGPIAFGRYTVDSSTSTTRHRLRVPR
ncbi:MAG: hypothetical protein Q9224_007217, partial [Gallowayella concinna]